MVLEIGGALVAIGAGVAVGFAGLGSGLGQGIAAAGGVGAVAEDRGMFAQGLIFAVLAETQAIYGLLIAILLMLGAGILGGATKNISVAMGLAAVGAGAAIGFAGLGSGIGQGITGASSVGAVVEDKDMFAQGLIFAVLSETQAIYGLLVAILIMLGVGLLGGG
ncbi:MULTISPECIES: ATP synthase subunit K [Methanobacterium]|jgi:V/A-type H+-transporting ATPase subunit K|uniref:V-type ATP synthase subunit K n=1 Tax=Methanobacterium veterum TaxID=408577 RepID=A0A9E5A1I2_9EURY|nr:MULTISPECIES: ATP synthase subunit K [Methanobacterium]MCZ3366335.1 V-type ATP synthase subunit K [Methanobacterium veterum]MCZ3371843.1 V-type ATP synthase subunit K [Methanobacterium veterum]